MTLGKKMSVRLTENQLQVLDELREILNCPISLLIRAIIGDWLQKNEDYIYEIIDGRRPFNKDWIHNESE